MPRAQPKPIQALYVVYVLRSTISPSSFYIGSTTDPQRRLRQHNGEAKGGAARTARKNKRPWEMVAVVSGFPGTVAALRFEWALDHPHLSSHILPEQRVSKSRSRRKPPVTVPLLVANFHILLRAPVFSRWPLKIHFFARDMHKAWAQRVAGLPENERLRASVPVLTDFGPSEGPAVAALKRAVQAAQTSSKSRRKKATPASSQKKPLATAEVTPAPTPTPTPTWGMYALPLDYAPLRAYVEKAHGLFSYDEQGDCVFCGEEMPDGKGMYVVCPASVCEAVGHLTCWSEHLIAAEKRAAKKASKARQAEAGADVVEPVIPVSGKCKSCKGKVEWGDMMKELTLRLRGPKEVDVILNPKKRRRKAGTQEEDDEEDEEEEDDDD